MPQSSKNAQGSQPDRQIVRTSERGTLVVVVTGWNNTLHNTHTHLPSFIRQFITYFFPSLFPLISCSLLCLSLLTSAISHPCSCFLSLFLSHPLLSHRLSISSILYNLLSPKRIFLCAFFLLLSCCSHTRFSLTTTTTRSFRLLHSFQRRVYDANRST